MRYSSRPMDRHIKGVQALGADVDLEYGYIYARARNRTGNRVYLDFPSGATENIMMMAARHQDKPLLKTLLKSRK